MRSRSLRLTLNWEEIGDPWHDGPSLTRTLTLTLTLPVTVADRKKSIMTVSGYVTVMDRET